MNSRDSHLFDAGRKRILSLDGGGVRGIVSLMFLERIEKLVDEMEGRPTRLCDWFDLIGGTSTGAIIATALALGYRVADVKKFYETLTPRIFKKSRLRLFGLNSKFDARHLIAELSRVIGKRSMDSEDLLTGLCIVLKRMDTGSAWLVMNNPRSKFWESPADGSFLGNRHLALAEIVRASTAAPSFFDPQLIPVSPGQPPGLFIDGGLTPHNNPALLLLMAAILPPHGLNWSLGPDKLLLVSVGTGTYRPTLSPAEAKHMSSIGLALRSLGAMIAESQQLVLTLMTYLGQSPTSWPINSEIGDLGRLTSPMGDLFRFLRYDIKLEPSWLKQNLNRDLPTQLVGKLRHMDDPSNVTILRDLATIAAEQQIKPEDLSFAPPTTRPNDL